MGHRLTERGAIIYRFAQSNTISALMTRWENKTEDGLRLARFARFVIQEIGIGPVTGPIPNSISVRKCVASTGAKITQLINDARSTALSQNPLTRRRLDASDPLHA
jgi:hypothetical protein